MAFSVGVCIVSVTEPLLFFSELLSRDFTFNSGTQLTSITQSSRELNLNRINDGHIFSPEFILLAAFDSRWPDDLFDKLRILFFIFFFY